MIASLSDLLQSVRIVRADFAVALLAPGHALALPRSATMHIHLMLGGEAHFTFADAGHAITLYEGQYLFAPQNTVHAVHAGANPRHHAVPLELPARADQPPLVRLGEAPPAARILTCAVEVDRIRHESLVRLMPEIRAYRRRKGPSRYGATPLLSMAAVEQAASGPGASALLLTVAELLLVHATRDSLLRGASPATGIGTPDSPQIAAALRLIYEHPERAWSVASLAQEVGMSRSVFAATFAGRLDETPMRYITRVRMMRAETLLRDGGRSVPEIAHLTGYESEAAFARAFKRAFDKTPGAFRRACRDR